MMTIILTVLLICGILAILYLLMIMPRMIGRPSEEPFLGVFYAHRGLHDNDTHAPENSLAAFQMAVDAGFGIELDIQLTKDKIPVVFHDFTLNRICGEDGKVRDYTYEELQQFRLCKSTERIPKFEEVLTLVNGKVPLIVEFKGDSTDMSLCPIADRLLREYKGVYCMESFNPFMVAWYKKNHREVFRGQLSEKFFANGKKSILHFFLENLMSNFIAKPDFIAYKYSDHDNLSRRICCNFFGATAITWTIKSQEDLNEMQKHFEIFIFEGFLPNNS